MSKKTEKNIIAYVGGFKAQSVDTIRQFGKKRGVIYKVMVIQDLKYNPGTRIPEYDILIQVDFNRPEKIAEVLLPYQDRLLAISCRNEPNIARFAKVVSAVPYLRTPTSESLTWATDKYEMRKRFKLYDPKITPKFTRIKDVSLAERKRIIQKIGFPMIVKPANLSGSLFVSICYHEE